MDSELFSARVHRGSHVVMCWVTCCNACCSVLQCMLHLEYIVAHLPSGRLCIFISYYVSWCKFIQVYYKKLHTCTYSNKSVHENAQIFANNEIQALDSCKQAVYFGKRHNLLTHLCESRVYHLCLTWKSTKCRS